MKRGALALGLVLGLLPLRALGEDPEPAVVEEILQVLTERGLIDAGEHDRLVARYHAQEQQRRSLLSRVRLTGDLRLRAEGFWFDEDATGDDPSNRFRGRYRLRLGADVDVNDWMIAHFRLASGEDDLRSTNTSFGRPGPDFDPDDIFIDRASLELFAPESWVPMEEGFAGLEVGKQPNPFLWKGARDGMLWDNDIMPEGVAARLRGEPISDLRLFANAGYFIMDENSSSSDPHLIGTQLGAEWSASEQVSLGGRASWYGFRSLDSDFVMRGVDGSGGSTAAGGNIVDGLLDGAGDIDVGELGVYLTLRHLEGWPITAFGYLSNNFSAEDSELYPQAGADALAWNLGLEVGDKKQVAALGVAYLHMEANAFPSQFIDSDFLDGETNREGLAFWGVRQILPSTDLQVTVFMSQEIDDALPAYQDSVGGAERLRLQTDLIVGF
jgi:hypothetical protein